MTLAIQFVYVFLMAVVLALIGQRFFKKWRERTEHEGKSSMIIPVFIAALIIVLAFRTSEPVADYLTSILGG